MNQAKANSALNSHCHLKASELNEQFLQKMGKDHQNGFLSNAAPKIENSFMMKRNEHYKDEYKTVKRLEQKGKWNIGS